MNTPATALFMMQIRPFESNDCQRQKLGFVDAIVMFKNLS